MTALHSVWLGYWQHLTPGEKTGLRIATIVAGVFLWGFFWLAPALQILQRAPAQHLSLDRQLHHMQRLQASARALQAQPRASRDAMVQALERTLKPLGSGVELQVTGDQLTLTLRQIPAPVLADWLIQSREQAHMQASEVRLIRHAAAPAAAWDGTLVYGLPPG